MFVEDPDRFRRFSIEFDDMVFDYSKNRITEETMSLLIDLANASNVPDWIHRMMTGERINITENRAVLHTALRNRSGTPVYVEGQDVMPGVHRVLEKMRRFTEALHTGAVEGIHGKTHYRNCEHRHRWLRSGAVHGYGSASAVLD